MVSWYFFNGDDTMTTRDSHDDSCCMSHEKDERVHRIDHQETVHREFPYTFFVVDVQSYQVTWKNVPDRSLEASLQPLCLQSLRQASQSHEQQSLPDALSDLISSKKSTQFEFKQRDTYGHDQYFDIHLEPMVNQKGEISHIIEYWIDLTSQSQLEQRRQLEIRIRDLLSHPDRTSSLIEKILTLIHTSQNYASVSIYLKEPSRLFCYKVSGMIGSHMLHRQPERESFPSSPAASPPGVSGFIETIAQRMLSGEAVGLISNVTEGGSFWCNHLSQWVAEPPLTTLPLQEISPPSHAKHMESLAFIPIRSSERTFGLLHIGDYRPNCFTDEDIRSFESISAYVGLALERIQVQDKQILWTHIIDESPFPVLRLTQAGNIVYANPSGRKLLERYPRECKEKVPSEWKPLLIATLKTQQNKTEEVSFASKVISLLFVPVPETNDVNVYGRDISDLRQAEESLRVSLDQLEIRVKERTEEMTIALDKLKKEVHDRNLTEKALLQSEQEYRDLVELLPDGICVITQEHITFMNKAGLDLLHADDATQIVGQSIWQFIHPDFSRLVHTQLTRLCRQVRRLSFTEICLIGLNGQSIHIEANVATIVHRNEPGILVVFRNIDERKQQQQALQQSEARLADAERMAHLGNWKWDLTTGRMEWSDEMYRIFGLNKKELHPTYEVFRSFVHPADRKTLNGIVNSTRMTRESYRISYRIQRSSLPLDRIVHERARVQRDFHHHPLQFIGTVQDITEQKQVETKLVQYQQQLRSLSADLQLSEERERRRIAADLHDSIGQILSFTIRELGLLQKSIPEPLVASLQHIGEQLNKAVAQTRTLTFDLSPSILYDMGLQIAVDELAQQLFKKSQIQYRFVNCPESLALAEPVKILLYRSLRELLINVVKHAHATFVEIIFHRAGQNIQITIRDNGQGFDLSILDHTTQSSPGFGLFSIRERLAYIGGYFKIESTVGKGTQVSLIAPMDPGADVKDYTHEHTNHISG